MSAVEPSRDCPRCPRLVAFREAWRAKQPSWFNAPVASFGPADARLLIVGLAPGLQGANRTGRPFTGDYAGVLLYETLAGVGFSRGKYLARPEDGLGLAPCRDFVVETIAEMARLKLVVALGRIAHDTVGRALGARPTTVAFAHA